MVIRWSFQGLQRGTPMARGIRLSKGHAGFPSILAILAPSMLPKSNDSKRERVPVAGICMFPANEAGV